MTLDPKKNKNIKQINIPKQINSNTNNEEFNSSRSANSKLTKENYEKLQKLTGSGFSKYIKNNIQSSKIYSFYIIKVLKNLKTY